MDQKANPIMKSIAEYLPARYWLMKTEPDVFSFDDLLSSPKQITFWEGVRNYQARNFMLNDMCLGDQVLFYHSNAKPSGIVGLAEVVSSAQIDTSAFDLNSQYFDPKSSKESPRWWAVAIGKPRKFETYLSLDTLRSVEELKGMLLLRNGQRLSIQPVAEAEYQVILRLGS